MTMQGSVEVTAQLRIAVAAEFRKLAAAREATEKARFLAANAPGTRQMVVDDEGTTIGSVTVKKPAKPTDRFEITDEPEAMAWALAEFGEDMVETVTRLTVQGRKSVLEAAKRAHEQGEELPQGVTWSAGIPGSPSVAWTPEKGVDAGALIAAMATRGAIDPRTILEIGESA